jgi:hypothetical protein
MATTGKSWWELEDERRLEVYRVRMDFLDDYPHSKSAGLIGMITHLAGRTMLRDAGE